jgi:hypothetical protein
MATVEFMGEHPEGPQDPEQQIAVLQSRVRERLAELRLVRPGAESYLEGADEVIAAATELIDYEERLPVLLDAAPRRLSLLIVRWAGVVTGAVGISLAIAAVIGWLPRWWLLVVVLPVAGSATLLRLPVHPPCDRHLSLRPGAILVALGALVIAIGGAGMLSLWVLGAGALLLVGGFLLVRRNAPGWQ